LKNNLALNPVSINLYSIRISFKNFYRLAESTRFFAASTAAAPSSESENFPDFEKSQRSKSKKPKSSTPPSKPIAKRKKVPRTFQ